MDMTATLTWHLFQKTNVLFHLAVWVLHCLHVVNDVVPLAMIDDYTKRKAKQRKEEKARQKKPSFKGAPTVIEPFNLTQPTPREQSVARVKQDMYRDQFILADQRWPHVENRAPKTPNHPLGPEASAYIAIGQGLSQPSTRHTASSRARAYHTAQTLAKRDHDALAAEVSLRAFQGKPMSKTCTQLLAELGLNDDDDDGDPKSIAC
eukprot:m.229041 g.229041  ORF g.229041 m.229041 type:complete len:206 (-) comp15202_c0_seq3:367-984(-)